LGNAQVPQLDAVSQQIWYSFKQTEGEKVTQDQPIAPFDWFANQFTSGRREEFIEKVYPHMKAFLKPDNRVVDLCCGAGSITIFLEEQGAQIIGIDLAPYLITLAREEAVKRGAKANFVHASVLNLSLIHI